MSVGRLSQQLLASGAAPARNFFSTLSGRGSSLSAKSFSSLSRLPSSRLCGAASSSLSPASAGQPAFAYSAKRSYLHFERTMPEDFELPSDTMPKNVAELMSKNPKDLDFFENYWYWKLRGEAVVLDPASLPRKSYKQLARDMGMQIVTEETEHMVGLLELYEHLRSAAFVGPFGTVEKPVLCPSVTTDRIVGCTGGTGEKEHVPLWFRCREGFLYRCGECDQIFMLVRVFYSLPDGKDPFPVDPDVEDVFDMKLLEKGQKMWNCNEYVRWPAGHQAYSELFLEGKWGNEIPRRLAEELKEITAA
ncbi:putative cytochrome c oxidase subunit [Besnoitia besnoiti]|uniref:Putative cytochrome c oxidase subunit n=1 Tax=Besnoitia besnoiti TaxID=94643 RepID=A0A2A9M1L2_BESBE|nr:putative cytochrome c oxidase subunit [Besnoitia besnoiti]PFH31859.1 putative cytochrome c oxidase subunit [Besnoitia besnoiti]